MLQRHAAHWLDEIIAEGLCRHAIERVERRGDSQVLTEAHTQLAYGAMLDEMLAQLLTVSATGREVGVPTDFPSETDSDS